MKFSREIRLRIISYVLYSMAVLFFTSMPKFAQAVEESATAPLWKPSADTP